MQVNDKQGWMRLTYYPVNRRQFRLTVNKILDRLADLLYFLNIYTDFIVLNESSLILFLKI